MSLDPSESINNMGSIRVDVLDAKDLPSADRNGFSDPYCKFELSGKEVFKTQVQKKTLHPTWNEFFEVEIASRTAANFICKVYDWDFASEPDKLGTAPIRLDMLEPFKPQEVILTLNGKSGTVRLRLLFRPAYVQRSRQGSSTFHGTFATPGRMVTGVAGAPIKGVGFAAHGVGKGASFIRHGFRGKNKDPDVAPKILMEDDASAVNGTEYGASLAPTSLHESFERPVTPSGSSLGAPSPHSRTKSVASVYGGGSIGAVTGTANFTIVSATGYSPSSSILVIVKQLPSKKTLHRTKHVKSSTGTVNFDESFSTKCSADAQFQLSVRAHATFGSDEELGDSLIVVDETGSEQEKVITAGSGTVIVKSNFVPAQADPTTGSPQSVRRKSFLGRRENGRVSRDGTPAAS